MMYNRYIPQPDGSFSRCRLQDKAPENKRPTHQRPPGPPPKQERPSPPPPEPCQPQKEPPKQPQRPPCMDSTSIPDFFRQLLPKGLDTGDLLVILLLLLMAGDCKQDQNSAMLTLVLYLFL